MFSHTEREGLDLCKSMICEIVSNTYHFYINSDKSFVTLILHQTLVQHKIM